MVFGQQLLIETVFVAPTMSAPPKRTQWREDLQNFRRDHGLSKKVLLDCCLVRRVIAWAAPSTKGRSVCRVPSQAELLPLLGLLLLWTCELRRATSCSSGKCANKREEAASRVDRPPF